MPAQTFEMKRLTFRILISVAAAVCLFAVSAAAQTGAADAPSSDPAIHFDEPKLTPQNKSRQFGSKSGAVVNEALTLMESNRHSAAILKLSDALSLDLNPYERSTVLQMMGAAYYEQGDYDEAISSIESAINAGGLLPKESTALRLNIGQLMIAAGRTAEGEAIFEPYWEECIATNCDYSDTIVWQLISTKRYEHALPWAEKWFRAASPKEERA